MNTVYITRNITLVEKLETIIREYSYKDSGKHLLKRLDDIINWNEIVKIANNYLPDIVNGEFENTSLLTLIKCFIIEKIFNYSDYKLYLELTERKIFQNFIGIPSVKEIPKIKIISSFRNSLMVNGLHDMLIDEFHQQMLEMKLNILDYSIRDSEKKHVITISDDTKNDFENKIINIEDSIRNLYKRKLPDILLGISDDKAIDVMEKLMNIKIQIDGLSILNTDSTSPEFQKLLDIEKSIHTINDLAEKLEAKTDNINSSDSINDDKLHLKLYNTFFDNLDNNEQVNGDKVNEDEKKSENAISEKIKYADEILKELQESLQSLEDISPDKVNGKLIKEIDEGVTTITSAMDNGDENVINIREHVPILLNPKMKTEGIFNDENLTEDYELGFRFHQLGLKMGFFNVKLDSQNESTRISTAEFFPNTFWSSVKQRSRWIAGICLQNWKAHKWQGNIVTKYFLFRDRKPLFSLFGAFFSNVIFIYFIYTVLNNFFDFGPSVTLVKTGSPLWFLMIAILVFMVSRVFHRFIFTYNWYGFRFAFFSLSRLVLDTFVNFFAVLRAIKVFRQTKKKVVWDSTAHY
jgi:hypothetical protein